jgi:two-component system chemotaxis sensor kinase CheA
MNPLLAQFVAEARDLLQDAGQDILSLERTPGDKAAIDRLFRSVHTLKGSSGLFEVPPLTRVLHAVEDLFQAVREEGLALTPGIVDVVFQSLDQAGRWIEGLEQDETLPETAEATARTLVAEVRSRFGRRSGEVLATTAPRPGPAAAPPELVRWFDPDALRAAAAAAQAAGAARLVSYAPEEGCFFKGEDPLHLALQIPHLQAFAAEARAPWAPLSNLNAFACNLDFHALSTAPRGEIEALFRYVPDQVAILDLDPAALAPPPPAETGLPAVVVALLREQLDLLAIAAPAEECAGRIAAAGLVAANALRFADRAAPAAAVEAAARAARDAGTAAALAAAIGQALAATPPPAAPTRAAPRAPGVPAGAPPGAAPEHSERGARTLRVDQEKVDALMNLVGELVVAKNSLPFLARRAEQQFGARELGREIKDQYGVIDRIAQELQGAVMAVRMMPVGQVFQRFPRLVRDLARKLGKQVDLVIEGEQTQADKNVIEALFDPLLHMVRNSLDHGVERPDARRAAGKPEAATIRLAAQQDADQVVIEVTDDGRGIDPAVIKQKAYERGLLDEARLASISDEDATMLVFAAGFSTAEQISDLSGRGVGMDVVRDAVEKAGGRIAMNSRKGAGTTVRLYLPLSMAVSRVMTVTLDDRLFGIPMELIRETVKVPRHEIVRIKTSEAFVLRDQVIPLVHLAHLLQVPDQAAAAEEIAVLVVRVGGQQIGLGISAFGEGMEVILKPLEGLLARIVGYAGTALLGDGRVLLVLDLKELLA